MKKISIIVAIAANNAIGKDNKLLWHISEDLKRFKKLTTGHDIIMGENTYYSLPMKPLPNRKNIVITDKKDKKFDGCETVYSIAEAIDKCSDANESFVIGGSSVYSQFLKFANKLYITRVNKNFEADCFFPEINYSEWNLIEKQENITDEKNDFSYNYEIWKIERR
jgi:dihydrofolate reductase